MRDVIRANNDAAQRAVDFLRSSFSALPSEVRVVRAPYRICPLGAHVDHQFGPVAAHAIDHSIHLAYVPTDDGHVRLVSNEFPGHATVDIAASQSPTAGAWDNYARGAVRVLSQRGIVPPGMIGASIGGRSRSGLSSSAAIGVAYLIALTDCAGVELKAADLIRLDEAIETQFLGLKNGVLDPAAIVLARRGMLAEIDTRTCTSQLHEAPLHFQFIAFHSGIAKPLTPSNFNGRVYQSLSAAQLLSDAANLGLQAPRLGDVPYEVYVAHASELPSTERRRARHFYEEVARVREGVLAWQAGDRDRLGALMSDSARSSVENYECGTTPVRDLVELLNGADGVYGARFCGPGFRGCCVALVDGDAMRHVVEAVHHRYARRYPTLAEACWVLDCGNADGAGRVA